MDPIIRDLENDVEDEDQQQESLETDDHDEQGAAEEEAQQDEASAEGEEGEASEEEKKPKGKERARQRARERFERMQSENAELKRALARMAEEVRGSAEASRETAAAIRDANRPKTKPLSDQLQDELDEAARRVDPADPESMKRYHRTLITLTERIADAKAEERAARVVDEVKRAQPRPPSATQQELLSYAPWLREQPLNDAVRLKVQQIAGTRRIDLESASEDVRMAVYKAALVDVGNFYGRRVNIPRAAASNGSSAVNGTGSRSFGARQEAPPELTESMKALADYDPRTRNLPPAKRYTKYAQLLQAEAKRG